VLSGECYSLTNNQIRPSRKTSRVLQHNPSESGRIAEIVSERIGAKRKLGDGCMVTTALRCPLDEVICAFAHGHLSCSVVEPSFNAPSFGRAWGLPVFFPFPRARGCGAPEQTPRRKRACPARHRLFPLSRSTVPGPGPALSSRRGSSGVRPGV